MARHRFTYLLEYIPVRYQGLSDKQLQDRKDVFDFKDGRAPASVSSGMLSKIRNIVSGNPSQWVVCFIPASTRDKTYNRFTPLATRISEETGCSVRIDAVVNSVDTVSGHIAGKSKNPTANFIIDPKSVNGKKIILIDDVITRGRTFDDTADKLIRAGALTVQGLFVAKTIHPDLPQIERGARPSYSEYDIFDGMYDEEMAAELAEELAAEEAYEDEMMAELAAEEAYEDEMMAELAAEEAYEEEMMAEYYGECMDDYY